MSKPLGKVVVIVSTHLYAAQVCKSLPLCRVKITNPTYLLISSSLVLWFASLQQCKGATINNTTHAW